MFEALLRREERDLAAGSKLVAERLANGRAAAGFTWHRARQLNDNDDDGLIGLRGTTFVEVNDDGRVCYVREIAEPIVKPGSATADLLKAVAKAAPETPPGDLPPARIPTSASDLVAYLWLELQGSAGFRGEALRFFSDDVVYEDMNFPEPFVGKNSVAAFLEEFDIPGLTFVPDRISDGNEACCFTWEVDLGVEGASRVKGISFYECEKTAKEASGGVRVTYVRDIPESVMKPPPMQVLAAVIDPALRVFSPVSASR